MLAFIEGVAIKAGRHTLRITLQENAKSLNMILEGRVAGPWVAELSRVWADTANGTLTPALTIDLRGVTYADENGRRVLRDIVAQARPHIMTNTPWTQYLAEEISQAHGPNTNEEAGYGIRS